MAECGDVDYYNDSKGTNVGATLAALKGLPGPIVLLAGGQAKGGDFAPWRAVLAEKGRSVILFGEDAQKIAASLEGLPVEIVDSLQQAVERAHTIAQSGDAVLLSPGCASFDQFSGYAQRGERFTAAVKDLRACSA